MRLDQELVLRKLCESRQEAQELIKKSAVLVDGAIVTKQTKNIERSQELTLTSRRKFVSRGGDKLEGALTHVFGSRTHIEARIGGLSAIDVGSSTGGFTDCLLNYQVRSVVAVDVGTSQLHDRLRNLPSVTSVENTDIKDFKPSSKFNIVVADLSFISLEKIFNTVSNLGMSGSLFFILIKPQFEVGKGNTKKGIVKDESLVDDVLMKYQKLSEEAGLSSLQIFPCTIEGGDGNQEYFLYGIKK